MRLIALALFAVLVPQEKNEAEELFRKMEKKVAEAKSLQMRVAVTVDTDKPTHRGEILFGGKNLVRLEVEDAADKSKQSATIIVNGESAFCSSHQAGGGGGGSRLGRFEVPADFSALIRLGAARAGLLKSIDFAAGVEDAEDSPRQAFDVSTFKLGAKEKVGDREAQAVDYKLKKSGEGLEEDATVWIDLETHLPLKRSLKHPLAFWTETYSAIKIDERIDPAKFELPKKK